MCSNYERTATAEAGAAGVWLTQVVQRGGATIQDGLQGRFDLCVDVLTASSVAEFRHALTYRFGNFQTYLKTDTRAVTRRTYEKTKHEYTTNHSYY